ncbi:UNVERIFIED_CONTAM: hypothetical protein GTU68_015203 [Idotea baltica]|nr:hypothetical protein [Idotea baltica]
MKLLITGATGFIGGRILEIASQYNHQAIAAVRSVPCTESLFNNSTIRFLDLQQLDKKDDWSELFSDIDVVIHCAAQVQQMQKKTGSETNFYHQINTLATLDLANHAMKYGVKRFIFLSSIKVNGESSCTNMPFTETIVSVPEDPYAKSKYAAEQGLLKLAQISNMEVVIIRPPLVYGGGVKANFSSMVKIVSLPLPLPLGSIYNKRSFIYIDNLVDFIFHCCVHPVAANQVFLISDDHDLSTTVLVQELAKAMDKKVYLMPISEKNLHFIAKCLGKQSISERLCGNLQLNITKAKKTLNWTPKYTIFQGFKQTVKGFKKI